MRRFTHIGLILAAVLALVVPSVALAAEFVAPEDDSGNIVLSTTETHRNLYTAGGTVTVNSTTQGDAFVAGGTVTIDGPIESDAFVAGGTVTINNTIGGDVRAMGGTVTINAQIGGDVLAAGGTLILSEKAKVGGDLIIAGGTVTVNAPVAGSVRMTGGMLTINSKISGPITIRGAETVTFGPQTDAGATVMVRAEKEPVVKDGARIGNLDYQKSDNVLSGSQIARAVVVGTIIWILAYLLVALAFAWAAPRRIEGFAAMMKKRFWANAGIGLAALVVTPIVVIVLFVVVIGYQLALIALAAYIFALLIAWVMAVLWTGSWVYSLVTKNQTLTINWQTAVTGALVFTLVRFIPIVGSLLCFVVVLAAFGQLLSSFKATVIERQGENN